MPKKARAKAEEKWTNYNSCFCAILTKNTNFGEKIKPNRGFWHTYRAQEENTPRETGGVDLVVS
jgi:hypothetical protein